MAAENKQIIRRFVDDVMNGGKLALIADLFAPDYVPHDPSNPTRKGGVEGAREFASIFHTGLSNQQYIVEDMVGEGDLVAYRWTLRGTHTGMMMGIPPTGKSLNFTGMDMFRLKNGKIVESWVVADALTMLQQLGVIPPPGGPPPTR